MVLDFSDYSDNIFGATVNISCPCFLISENGGIYSKPIQVGQELFCGNPLIVSNYIRTGIQATFDMAGLTPGDYAIIFWVDELNTVHALQYITNGTKTIPGLTVGVSYGFDLFYNKASGEFALPVTFCDSYTATSTVTIHELLYAMIVNNPNFRAAVGAAPGDPEPGIYYQHPIPDLKITDTRPGYVTYFMETGDGITDERTGFAQEGNQYFRFDIWANTYDSMQAIWDALRIIFSWQYYKTNTNYIVKQIKVQNIAEMFEQDQRIFHKSITVLVRFLWTK